MNPAMQIATTLAEAVEWFRQLPDDFQDEAMAEQVAKSVEEWKREAPGRGSTQKGAIDKWKQQPHL